MENSNKDHKCDHNHEHEHESEEKVKDQNTQEENIITFSIGDERHPIHEDDEEISFIGERIRALENLENCKNLKVNIY
jgi:hypothetical protein